MCFFLVLIFVIRRDRYYYDVKENLHQINESKEARVSNGYEFKMRIEKKTTTTATED